MLFYRNPLQPIADDGFLMVRGSGRWSPYCADGWTPEFSVAICINLGFKTGTALKASPTKIVQMNQTCSQVVYLQCE